MLDKLLAMLRKGENIDRSRIRYAIDLAKEGNADLILELIDDVVAFTNKGRKIKCRTLGQKKYISALKRNTVVFGSRPCGYRQDLSGSCHGCACVNKIKRWKR